MDPVRKFPTHVAIRDVGPRDGLQPEAPVPVTERIRLVEALQDAGVRRIEVAAFVSPKAVPAMAGAAEVLAGIARRPDTTYAALVPNLRGAADALGAGADELTVTISASEAYNQRNVHLGVKESVAVVGAISELAAAPANEAVTPVDAVISCAFGSPYEGEIAPRAVAELAQRLVDLGVAVTYADTTGMATPRRIDDLLDALTGDLGDRVGLHLHDTRGTGLVNAYAALERGVARFDTCVGGLGGSPFAHGAGGNLATEGLVAMLDDLDIATGIDLDRLLDVAAFMEDLVGRSLP
ncbi:MAG: hydroxymethylglutaryl-CoA lyase, partial [Actinomycetota bacterium]|nr:hydroxymethylglutaryl-CoA lyase [Actinomycetota bacterium]